MSDWFETLEGLHDHLWDALVQGIVDPNHPARYLTLATTGPEGWPEARTVILRGADQIAGAVSVFSDLHSAKVASLRQNPRAALHVWDAGGRLQLRLTGTVTIRHGQAVAHIWDQLPAVSRESYGVAPAPGKPIAAALDYVKSPDPTAFAVLDCTISSIDVLHLGSVHRRARFDRAQGWHGQWLVP